LHRHTNGIRLTEIDGVPDAEIMVRATMGFLDERGERRKADSNR